MLLITTSDELPFHFFQLFSVIMWGWMWEGKEAGQVGGGDCISVGTGGTLDERRA